MKKQLKIKTLFEILDRNERFIYKLVLVTYNLINKRKMNNGQVAGYVNFYHATEEAWKKSIDELTHEVVSYERREDEARGMSFLKRLFYRVGDPEIHIINQSVLREKQERRSCHVISQ